MMMESRGRSGKGREELKVSGRRVSVAMRKMTTLRRRINDRQTVQTDVKVYEANKKYSLSLVQLVSLVGHISPISKGFFLPNFFFLN